VTSNDYGRFGAASHGDVGNCEQRVADISTAW
jgi:hypothetical protein